MAWIQKIMDFLGKLFGWEKTGTDIIQPVPASEDIVTQTTSENKTTANSEYLYSKSKSYLGTDVTPTDAVPDVVACVVSFQEVFRRTFGRYIGTGPALYNCKYLRDALLKDKEFVQVSWEDALYGDVCVFPTYEGKDPKGSGHVFIVGKNQWMSNNSYTGIWDTAFIKQSAEKYYITDRGFKPYIFRIQ